MLIKMEGKNSKGSFEDVIRLRIRFNVLLAVLSFAAVLLAVLFGKFISSDFVSGVFMGMGSGLLPISLLLYFRNKKLLNDKQKMQNAEIEEKDERNKFLMLKSSSLSFYVLLFLLYAAMIIAGLFNEVAIFLTILFTTLAMLAIMGISYLVLRKKY